jgi:hydroxypyruvate reductase
VKVLATKRLPGEAWAELGDVEIGTVDDPRDDVEVLIVAGDIVDDALLDRLPSLRLVASYGVGYDNVDADACRLRGVAVTNTPGVLDAATADLTIALMLAVRRRVVEGDALVRAGRWGTS